MYVQHQIKINKNSMLR